MGVGGIGSSNKNIHILKCMGFLGEVHLISLAFWFDRFSPPRHPPQSVRLAWNMTGWTCVHGMCFGSCRKHVKVVKLSKNIPLDIVCVCLCSFLPCSNLPVVKVLGVFFFSFFFFVRLCALFNVWRMYSSTILKINRQVSWHWKPPSSFLNVTQNFWRIFSSFKPTFSCECFLIFLRFWSWSVRVLFF